MGNNTGSYQEDGARPHTFQIPLISCSNLHTWMIALFEKQAERLRTRKQLAHDRKANMRGAGPPSRLLDFQALGSTSLCCLLSLSTENHRILNTVPCAIQ